MKLAEIRIGHQAKAPQTRPGCSPGAAWRKGTEIPLVVRPGDAALQASEHDRITPSCFISSTHVVEVQTGASGGAVEGLYWIDNQSFDEGHCQSLLESLWVNVLFELMKKVHLLAFHFNHSPGFTISTSRPRFLAASMNAVSALGISTYDDEGGSP
jgi:hypothetical protein